MHDGDSSGRRPHVFIPNDARLRGWNGNDREYQNATKVHVLLAVQGCPSVVELEFLFHLAQRHSGFLRRKIHDNSIGGEGIVRVRAACDAIAGKQWQLFRVFVHYRDLAFTDAHVDSILELFRFGLCYDATGLLVAICVYIVTNSASLALELSIMISTEQLTSSLG